MSRPPEYASTTFRIVLLLLPDDFFFDVDDLWRALMNRAFLTIPSEWLFEYEADFLLDPGLRIVGHQ